MLKLVAFLKKKLRRDSLKKTLLRKGVKNYFLKKSSENIVFTLHLDSSHIESTRQLPYEV